MSFGDWLLLGVDGGGTGCRARLEDQQGNILGAGMAGPATTRFGIDTSWSAIETACRGAIKESGIEPARIATIRAGIGLAGLNRAGAKAALLRREHPFASIAFATDGMIACLGAHAGNDGAVVIVGTGSCGIGLIDGSEIEIGGYGFPISDEGSGADLGLNAIRLSLRARDGRRRHSALTREVMARFDDEPVKAVGWMDRATATDYAKLAPLVLRHAERGDPTAQELVRSAAEEVGAIIRTLRNAGAVRISLLGGMASAISVWLAPDLRSSIQAPLGDALDGALLLAGCAPDIA